MAEATIDWTEQYRPMTLDDVVGQEKAVNGIRRQIEQNLEKDIILYGPPGTGKTSIAGVFARTILPYYPEGCTDLNAGDINKKAEIHESIIENSRIAVRGPFKVIILDEAEELSKKAWMSLKRWYEKKSKKIKVVICVNDLSKVPVAIQSRCARYYIGPLSPEVIAATLQIIAYDQQVDISPEDIYNIASTSKGDLRQAINRLQCGQIDQPEDIDVGKVIRFVQKGKARAAYMELITVLETTDTGIVIRSLFNYILDQEQFPEMVFVYLHDMEKDLGAGMPIYTTSMDFVIKTKRLFVK